MYILVKKVQIRTPKPKAIRQGPCWSLAACAQGQLWRGIIGHFCPSAQVLAVPLVFADPDLLICFADLLSVLCSSGRVLWDGAVLGRALPCPLPSPAACASPALVQHLLLLLPDTVFSILAAFFFLLLKICLALSSRKEHSNINNFRPSQWKHLLSSPYEGVSKWQSNVKSFHKTPSLLQKRKASSHVVKIITSSIFSIFFI